MNIASFNKANVSVVGPWLVVLALGLDAKFGWGFSAEWYGAAASLIIWVATYAVPNIGAPTPTDSAKSGI